MNKMSHTNLPGYQRGAASLLIALVVLTTITMISIYTSRTVVMEQNIASNDYRGRMAFEAAEAGQDMAISYIANGRNPDDDVHPVGATNAGRDWLAAEVDADGNDISDPNEWLFGTTNTLTLPNGSSATVTLRNRSTDEIISTEITSVGRSDDNAATRTITQTVTLITPLPNIPENPLLTRSTVNITGNADIFNPEGHSTIWSGGPADLSAATVNTNIANPAGANYPDCLGDAANPCSMVGSSSNSIAGLDIVEQDSSLANLTKDEFFLNFFGKLPTEYRNSMVTMDLDMATTTSATASTTIQLATNPEIIWIEGDLDLSAGSVIGCAIDPGNGLCTGSNIQPVIMVVNGDLTYSGRAQFYGMLYIAGQVKGNGTPTTQGSIVVAGDPSDLKGNFNITYNSDILRQTGESGKPASGGGSWRDFK